ncbi:Monocarboxylate transporter 12 [Armadillidium vulgare]|nr:Monocarboxylate transporter 12 [Armadillidium vulgare]
MIGAILCFVGLSLSYFCTIGPSGYKTLLNVVLAEQFGKTSITSTWGFIRMVHGIFSFINSPLIGAIIDASNSYVFAFIFMGGGMLISAIFLLLEPLVIKKINSPIIIT